MKEGTLKFILLVIIPVVILIGVGIYYIFQIPQVQYNALKYVTNFTIDRRIRKGKISQNGGVQLKKAYNRFFQAQIKIYNSKLDRKKIEKEIDKMLEEKQIHQNREVIKGRNKKLTDDEVSKVVNYLNEISQVLEQLLKNSTAEPQ